MYDFLVARGADPMLTTRDALHTELTISTTGGRGKYLTPLQMARVGKIIMKMHKCLKFRAVRRYLSNMSI